MKWSAFVALLWLALLAPAEAQTTQCPTATPGAISANCASDAFVTQSRGTLTPEAFAGLAACTSSNAGTTADVTDSTTETFGATITGGGSFHVLAYCNGTSWTVAGGGVSPGGGTVTSVGTAGLATGGPITGSGAVTVPAAVKSDQTTATSNAVAVTPGVQQFHPSAAKVWAEFTGSGTNGAQAINSSFNVASIIRTSAGNYTVTFTVSFTTIHYACFGASYAAGATNSFVNFGSALAGSINENFVNISGPAAFDPTSGASIVCFGTE
ncbi:hypothetical protein [Bradyrhizobium sp.]